MASELLYGSKALYYQSNAASLLQRSEQAKASILSDSVSDDQKLQLVECIADELSLVPAGFDEDLTRRKTKLPSIGRQIADVRQL
jgi:hypothetical protein